MIQTAFLGDVVLTLPLAAALRRAVPGAAVDLVVAPRGAAVLAGHPDVRETIVYDKRGADAGVAGFFRILRRLREGRYATALVPHRSLRSALLARMAGIPVRAGFDASAGSFLFTHVARYDRGAHEIDRNISLLRVLSPPDAPGARPAERPLPKLSPPPVECAAVDRFLAERGPLGGGRLVAIAPGTAWNTKRWPRERFASLARMLCDAGCEVVLVGGAEDAELCAFIRAGAAGAGPTGSGSIADASGKFGVLGSAELLRRCALLVCNDSAPLHLAGAVGTPVLAIFGATTPAFGFGPTGPADRVLETGGLACRPCSIHGGERCPIGTFECMLRISPEAAAAQALAIIGGRLS